MLTAKIQPINSYRNHVLTEWYFLWTTTKIKISKNYSIFFDEKNTKVLALQLVKKEWSRGRVARQSSAKASTAVRIRSRPQLKPFVSRQMAFLFKTTSLSVVQRFHCLSISPSKSTDQIANSRFQYLSICCNEAQVLNGSHK